MIDGSAGMQEVWGVKQSAALAILCFAAFLPDLRGAEPQSMSPGEIHSMPREKAALALPVKVRGVVSFAYPESVGSFVIEDESGGLYIAASRRDRDQPSAVQRGFRRSLGGLR